jgi:beta-glucosidase-like glycosyl hydrolase
MTTAEKISQMIVFAAAIPRLGIPKYNWWHEALHGIAGANYGGDLPASTSFPMTINLGATFNRSLV